MAEGIKTDSLGSGLASDHDTFPITNQQTWEQMFAEFPFQEASRFPP
jgi:hypothetical protein